LSPFFDIEDDYVVSRDLWRIGNIAISLLELFYGVNKSVGSIKFVDDLSERFGVLVDQNKALHAGMASTERYKAAAAKAATTKAGQGV
jgi:hypothetical protein